MPGYGSDGTPGGRRAVAVWVYQGIPGGTPLVAGWVFDGAPGGRRWFVFPGDDDVFKNWAEALAASDDGAVLDHDARVSTDDAVLAETYTLTQEDRNVLRQWIESLAASDDGEKLDQDFRVSTDDAVLAELWSRSTDDREILRQWAEALSASDDGAHLDLDARSSTDDAVLAEFWSRTTEPRPPAGELTDADWERTGLTSCPTAVETHCVGWRLSDFPADHHIRILRATNSGALLQVATGISLTNNACSFSGSWDGTAQFTLPFGDNPGFNFTDEYRYRIQLRRDSDNAVIDERDTPNRGSSHHDCIS